MHVQNLKRKKKLLDFEDLKQKQILTSTNISNIPIFIRGDFK
jgi:hypothetical protein